MWRHGFCKKCVTNKKVAKVDRMWPRNNANKTWTGYNSLEVVCFNLRSVSTAFVLGLDPFKSSMETLIRPMLAQVINPNVLELEPMS